MGSVEMEASVRLRKPVPAASLKDKDNPLFSGEVTPPCKLR